MQIQTLRAMMIGTALAAAGLAATASPAYAQTGTEASEEAAAEKGDGMCDKLLANPVIEEYRFELVEVLG